MHNLSATENTNLLKKFLSAKFKNGKFSIKSNYSSLRCNYDLGPDQKEVSSLLKNLQHGTFNGMDDSYNYHDTDSITVDGKKLNTFNYVFTEQHIPNEIEYKLAKLFSDMVDFANTPKLLSQEQLHLFIPQSDFGHNWGNILHRFFKIKNFATNNQHDINLLSCHWDDKHDGIFFKYKYKGKEYTSQSLKPINQPKETETTSEVSIPSKIELESDFTAENLKNIELVEYSEKAFALIGEDTKSLKEILKDCGGSYNRYLTINDEKVAGWIFSKKKSEETYNLIKQLKGL